MMSTREIRPTNSAGPVQVVSNATGCGQAYCPLCGLDAKPVYKLKHTTVYECGDSHCGLQFASPQLDDEALGRAYTDLYYPPEDGGQVVLENATEFEVRKFLSAIEKHTGSLCGKRVLDYGCGNGVLLRIAGEMGAEPVGVEQSATAREHIAVCGYGNAYVDISAMRRQEPIAKFDFIMMCDAIEHLRQPWVDLAKLRALLRPGGCLFLTTPNTRSLRSRISGVRWDQRNNPTHFYYFDSRSLSQAVTRAGFNAIAELKPITEYRHHGPVRRALQRGLARLGLHGGLLFMASR